MGNITPGPDQLESLNPTMFQFAGKALAGGSWAMLALVSVNSCSSTLLFGIT